MLLTAGLIVCLLAALVWAVAERRAARRWSRRHLAAAARLHESQAHVLAERRRSDALLVRLARTRGEAEALAEAAAGVALLGQLDALHSPAPGPGSAGLQTDSLLG